MRTAFPIPRPVLERALCVSATLRPANARRLLRAVAAIQAADSTDPSLGTLAGEHFARRQKTIRRFHRAIKRHLSYAAHETVRNIEQAGHRTDKPLHAAEGDDDRTGASGVAADLTFDPSRFAKGLLAALRNESGRGLQTAGNELFEELGDDAPRDPFKLPDPVALEYLDARENLLAGVPDEIHAQIVEALEDGLNAGDSTRDLARRITRTFAEIGDGRARTIASTETAAAYGFARQAGMKQARIPFKTWLTSHLKNVRPAHFRAERDEHNRLVPVDQPFQVGGENLMYPGDPAGSPGNTINCHCVALSAKP